MKYYVYAVLGNDENLREVFTNKKVAISYAKYWKKIDIQRKEKYNDYIIRKNDEDIIYSTY